MKKSWISGVEYNHNIFVSGIPTKEETVETKYSWHGVRKGPQAKEFRQLL